MNDPRIAEAFNRLAGEVSPRPATWQRVERGIRRRYRVHLFSGVIATITLVLAGVAVVPRVGDVLRNDRSGSPGGSAAPVTSTRVAFRDEFARYYFSFPSDLQFRGFQDGVPAVSLSTKDGGLTIEIHSQPPNKGLADTTKGLQAEDWETIAGGRAQRFVEPGAEGPQRREVYRITWDYGSDGLQKLIMLQFMATTSSQEARSKYGDLIQEIVRGTARPDGFRPDRWLDTTFYTPWGRVDAGVPFDDATSMVAQFLSARADDETVTDTRSGTTYKIDRYGISPSIFYEGGSLQAVPGYVIGTRSKTSNGDTQFIVHIDGGRDEAIAVGRNTAGELTIRGVRIL